MGIVSRASRREAARAAAEAPVEPSWSREPLTGFGIANVPGSGTKWFAYKLSTDGNVTLLTPLRGGQLLGEGKPNATGRLKVALMRMLGGVD